MFHHHLARTLLPGLALTLLPIGAQAQELTARTVAETVAEMGGWSIRSYAIDGQHMRCGAVATGHPSSQAAIEVSSEGWTVVVPATAKDQEMQGTVAIDGQAARRPFYAGEDGHMISFLTDAQLKRLRAGRSTTVTVGTDTIVVPLLGMGAVLDKTAECNDKSGE